MNDSNPKAPATRSIEVRGQTLGAETLFFLCGPCVLESRGLTFEIAGTLKEIFLERQLPFVFKASFDKANRTSSSAGRGPGKDEGLEWLAAVREELDIPVLTDVHLPEQCAEAAQAVDVLQIPAFLCRQTDLLVAAAESGAVVNVKKGQFLAPWDMQHAAKKVTDAGNPNVMLTERGSTHGYGRLVVDMTGFAHMAATGHPVIFDATHSVQEPGGLGARTGGDRNKVPSLARAALATGAVHGLFFEVHPDPDSSPSDGPNMVRLDAFADLVDQLAELHALVRRA